MSFRAHKFNAGQFMYKSKRNFQVKKYIYMYISFLYTKSTLLCYLFSDQILQRMYEIVIHVIPTINKEMFFQLTEQKVT